MERINQGLFLLGPLFRKNQYGSVVDGHLGLWPECARDNQHSVRRIDRWLQGPQQCPRGTINFSVRGKAKRKKKNPNMAGVDIHSP